MVHQEFTFSNHLHLISSTLNLEKSTIEILKNLGMIKDVEKSLPWKPSKNREKEDVRPVSLNSFNLDLLGCKLSN